MTIELIRDVLAWCSVINFSILLLWFMLFSFAYNWLYKLHSKCFTLSEAKFDTIHYSGMGFYKLCILLFIFVPYLAIRIVI